MKVPFVQLGPIHNCQTGSSCKRIVCGQYVADYSTTECRTFRPKGLRQLRTKLRMYSGRLVYIAMGDCVTNQILGLCVHVFSQSET